MQISSLLEKQFLQDQSSQRLRCEGHVPKDVWNIGVFVAERLWYNPTLSNLSNLNPVCAPVLEGDVYFFCLKESVAACSLLSFWIHRQMLHIRWFFVSFCGCFARDRLCILQVDWLCLASGGEGAVKFTIDSCQNAGFLDLTWKTCLKPRNRDKNREQKKTCRRIKDLIKGMPRCTSCFAAQATKIAPNGTVGWFGFMLNPKLRGLCLCNWLALACGSWTFITEDSGPSPRSLHVAAGVNHDRFWVHGGSGESLLDDLWVYHFVADVWTTFPQFTTAPSGRLEHVAVWDAQEAALWIHGGQNGSHFLNDLWKLSNNRWTQVVTGLDASLARSNHVAVWEPRSATLWIHGGYDGALRQDLWKYNSLSGSWTRIQDINPPSARAHHVAVIDETEQAIWLHAGHDGSASFASSYWHGFDNMPALLTIVFGSSVLIEWLVMFLWELRARDRDIKVCLSCCLLRWQKRGKTIWDYATWQALEAASNYVARRRLYFSRCSFLHVRSICFKDEVLVCTCRTWEGKKGRNVITMPRGYPSKEATSPFHSCTSSIQKSRHSTSKPQQVVRHDGHLLTCSLRLRWLCHHVSPSSGTPSFTTFLTFL